MSFKPIEVWPNTGATYHKDIQRFTCMMYVLFNKKEFYVQTSCADFNPATGEMKDFAIEFLTPDNQSNFTHPYNGELFEQIEDSAKVIFSEYKEEEQDSAAV